MGTKRPPLATLLVGNFELGSAYKLSEAKELTACYLKTRKLSDGIEELK